MSFLTVWDAERSKNRDWERLEKEGIQVAEFFPALLGQLQLRVNYRNHRKIVVIDGRVGFVGGFNVGREYLGRDKKFGYWRDTHLCIEGAAVTSLAVRFVLDWNYAAKENLFLEDSLFEIPQYTRNGRSGADHIKRTGLENEDDPRQLLTTYS